MKINWKHSEQGTLEGYLNGQMLFDINEEGGRFAVYEMKKPMLSAMHRADFSTLEIAQKHCLDLIK